MSQPLLDYYNSGIEEGRLTRNLCNRLEFETTLHILAPYLLERQTILEVGAGPGEYAIHLASQGHQVIAVDIVPAHIVLLQEKIARNKIRNLITYLADGRNLTMLADASVDVVLCFGPLYHLPLEADRQQCLAESLRVLKPGGILAIAYLNRFLVGALSVKRDANKANPAFFQPLIATGLIQDDPQDWFGLSAYCSTPYEMERLVTAGRALVLEHVAADGVSKLIEDTVNAMNEEQYQQWRAWHWQTLRERSILGYSTHGLIVCQKPKLTIEASG